MTENYQLVVSFPDESRSFVNGFEAGKLWHQMREGADSEIALTTHFENREVIRRMATADGWELECRQSEIDGWDYTTLRKTASADRLNPHGLRIVPDEVTH